MTDRGTIDAGRVCWALVPWNRRGGAEAARYAAEEFLPFPLEETHIVFAKLGADRALACAVERTLVEEAVRTGATSLRPSGVPDWVEGGVEPGAIELLVGEFEPLAARRLQRRRARLWSVAAVLAVLAVVVGLERRRANFVGREREAAAGVAAIAGRWGRPGSEHLPALARLEVALRSARAEVEAARAASVPDAMPLVAELFRAWPAGVAARTEEVSISGEAATISARFDDRAGAEGFIGALRGHAGLRVEPPLVSADRAGVRVRLAVARSGVAR